jgi:hypothetical protein
MRSEFKFACGTAPRLPASTNLSSLTSEATAHEHCAQTTHQAITAPELIAPPPARGPTGVIRDRSTLAARSAADTRKF